MPNKILVNSNDESPSPFYAMSGRRILVPLDGSGCAEQALAAAATLARHWQAEIILLRVQDFFVSSPLGAVPSQAVRWHSSGVRPYLERIGATLREQGISVRILSPTGRPSAQILRVARRHAAHVVVMSSHGRTGPLRWLLGSVTQEVLRRASCPVLVIRAQGLPVPEGGFQRALVPVDGSDYSYHVVGQVGPFLAPRSSPTLLCATNLTPLDLSSSERRACVRAIESELGGKFPDLRWLARDGDAAATILDEARAEGYDLIAMATHGRTGFRRFLLGSVAERIANHASCAVLVFPPTTRVQTLLQNTLKEVQPC